MIDMTGVSYRKQGKQILENINWQVNKGQHWVLMGLNGSGKTSLLNILSGNSWPTTGSVTVLGEKFGQTNIPALKKRIGWVSSILTTRLNLYEQVEKIILSGIFSSIGIYQDYGQKEIDQVDQVMALLNIEKLKGHPYNQCSQGQQQLVLIARALVAQPDLLILDEACNGLDLFATEIILDSIRRLSQLDNGPTIIFVTHHADQIIPQIENILLLKDGQIFQQGKTQDVLTKEVLKSFYDQEVQVLTLSNGRPLVYLD